MGDTVARPANICDIMGMSEPIIAPIFDAGEAAEADEGAAGKARTGALPLVEGEADGNGLGVGCVATEEGRAKVDAEGGGDGGAVGTAAAGR